MVTYPPAEHVLTRDQVLDKIRAFVVERINFIQNEQKGLLFDECLADRHFAYLSVLDYLDELKKE